MTLTDSERAAWRLARAQAAHVARMFATELLQLADTATGDVRVLRAKARTATDIADSINRLEPLSSYVEERKR